MSRAYFEARLRDAFRGYGVAWPGTARDEPTPDGHPFMSMADAVRIGGAMLSEFNQDTVGGAGGGILRKEYDRGYADGARNARLIQSEQIEFDIDEARREGQQTGWNTAMAGAAWTLIVGAAAYSLLTYLF
jgi:hypothetical protein